MYTILLVVTFVALVQGNDINIGSQQGQKIFNENVTASPAIWRQEHNVTVNATANQVISKIVVTDQRPEKDGEAKIVAGGEGQKNVTLLLKSPTALRGYNFHIEVYAADDVNQRDIKSVSQQNNNFDVTKNPIGIPSLVTSDDKETDLSRPPRKSEGEEKAITPKITEGAKVTVPHTSEIGRDANTPLVTSTPKDLLHPVLDGKVLDDQARNTRHTEQQTNTKGTHSFNKRFEPSSSPPTFTSNKPGLEANSQNIPNVPTGHPTFAATSFNLNPETNKQNNTVDTYSPKVLINDTPIPSATVKNTDVEDDKKLIDSKNDATTTKYDANSSQHAVNARSTPQYTTNGPNPTEPTSNPVPSVPAEKVDVNATKPIADNAPVLTVAGIVKGVKSTQLPNNEEVTMNGYGAKISPKHIVHARSTPAYNDSKTLNVTTTTIDPRNQTGPITFPRGGFGVKATEGNSKPAYPPYNQEAIDKVFGNTNESSTTVASKVTTNDSGFGLKASEGPSKPTYTPQMQEAIDKVFGDTN